MRKGDYNYNPGLSEFLLASETFPPHSRQKMNKREQTLREIVHYVEHVFVVSMHCVHSISCYYWKKSIGRSRTNEG